MILLFARARNVLRRKSQQDGFPRKLAATGEGATLCDALLDGMKKHVANKEAEKKKAEQAGEAANDDHDTDATSANAPSAD